MPARKDAEAGTVATPTADLGNVETAALIQDLGVTQDLVLAQEEMIQKLAAQVEILQKLAEPEPEPQVVVGPPPLREGFKRYSSRMTELTLMRVGTGHEMHGGVAVPVAVQLGKPIDFNYGVYETEDPGEIEFLETHEENGTAFWEDETAVKRQTSPEVRDGLRATEQSPRVPLTAPMGPQ